MTSNKLDAIDVKILRTLLIDGRTSFAEIGRECGVSTNTIFNRFHKLKKVGVITGTRLLTERSENRFWMSVGIVTNTEFEDEVIELMKSLPNIAVAYPQVGKFDIYATVITRNLDEIDQLREKLKTSRGIKNIVTSIWTGDYHFYLENLKILPNEVPKSG